MNPTLSRGLRVLTLAVLAAAGRAPAVAQEAQADCELRIAGGPAGKVYELMIKDMQAVCGGSERICPVASTGGLRNLSLMSASEAELGIVQVDTMRAMSDGGDASLQSLQVVMPLHANLLHVLTLAQGSMVDVTTVPLVGAKVPFTGAKTRFTKVSELRGRTVVAVGSAHLLATVLEAQYRLGLKVFAADTDDEALRVLRSGQAQAVLTLGGWPLPVVARQGRADDLMLADFDLSPSAPYALARRSYQNLDAFNLGFLAAPNVLVSRPFRPEGAAWRRVSALQRCLASRLDELQEGRYQAAWKEIKDSSATYGLKPFAGAPAEAAPAAKPARTAAKAR